MRLLSVLLIITFFVTNSFSKIKPRLAPLNPEYLEYLEKEKAGEIKRCTEDGHYLGYRPSPLYIITEIPGQNETDKFKSTEAYPAKYDLRELELVTSVKDQGDIGACWSFGVIGSIESNWLMNGLGEFDLSEENMATCHGFNYAKDEGGNLTIPVCYLVNFKGPLLEIEDPYMTDPLFGFCKTSGFNLTPAKYVSEARWIGGNKKAIKNTLMKYGAVTATITMEGYASYYNGTDNTMYYSGTDLNDHMILIVGWDDNKPVTGGTASPAGTHTGAWIIRNSWGDDWGEDGYAYVSYEDITFASHAAYFPTTFETNEIETVFMYDELGVVTWAGYPSDSVSALIKYNAPSKYFIDKIGVYIVAAGTTIDIEIYASKSGNTLSGLLASEYDIEISEAGYHLFDIAAMVEGDFYIKIKYLNPYTTYQVAVENEEENYALPDIEKGVCWMSLDEEEWDPLGSDIEDGEWDLCIKAYASSVNLPRAFFNVDKKEICKGSSVVFTDKSLGDNNTYSWNFGTGASPQTANTAGPHTVTYSTPGKKTISLTVTGTEGTNTITRDGYINVVDDIYVHLAADALIAIADIPIEIKAYGADEYSWSPSTGLDKTTGSTVITTLDDIDSIIYTVTGTQGSCSDEAEIIVYVWPHPDYDNICDAIEVSLYDDRLFTNIGATVEYNEPHPPLTGCFEQDGWCDEYRDTDPTKSVLDNTVWFYYIAPASGISSFRINYFDGAIALYDAETCTDLFDGNYTLVAANDDYIDEPPYWAAIDLRTDLIPNHKYWIQIDGSGGGKTGFFNLRISEFGVGIKNNNRDENYLFSIFPNPNDGILNIDYNGRTDSEVFIEIYNLEGKLVYTYTDQMYVEINNRLDLSDLQKGLYFIRLNANNETSDFKILIK